MLYLVKGYPAHFGWLAAALIATISKATPYTPQFSRRSQRLKRTPELLQDSLKGNNVTKVMYSDQRKWAQVIPDLTEDSLEEAQVSKDLPQDSPKETKVTPYTTQDPLEVPKAHLN